MLSAILLEEDTFMRLGRIETLILGGTLVLLTACGGSTKEDIIAKAKNASTTADLEKVLGRPDNVDKLGPIEKWTYTASNGRVVFLIVGDKVTLEATGEPEKQKR